MKKIISVMLTVCIIMCCFSMVAVADVGDYKFFEREPNDTPYTADVVYNDYTISGTLGNNDVDHYTFYLSQKSQVNIKFIADYSSLKIILLDSNENTIDFGDEYWYNSNPYDAIENWILPAGRYYIGVWNYENANSGNDYVGYIEYEPEILTGVWRKDANGWWFSYTEGGYPAKQWLNIDGYDYYFDARGYMVTGWLNYGGSWYYLSSSGEMATNKWVRDSKGWCYLGADGRMATNKWVKDSVGWCYVGSDGYCVTNAWKKDSVGWCYLDANGRMATNKWIRDSQGWCYVGANGYCVTNAWMRDSIGWCYLGADGRMVTNTWVMDSSGWCYIGANGYMV